MAKKLFLIIGAPGSGKTTDAELIAKNNPDTITHYSTGDMLRAEVSSGSERGKVIDSYISKGNIVPIEIAIETITNAIKSAPTKNIIIDGYPRSLEQMSKLDEYLASDSDIKLLHVIEVNVSESTAKDRVLGRSRGEDDNSEVFDNRMKIYTEPLANIQAFYKKKNLLHVIDGERSIEEIVDDMQKFILTNIKES